jgi:hypothetical protein
MRDLIKIFALLILLFAVVVSGVVLLSNWYGDYQCGKYEMVVGKQTKWITFDECYVQVNNGWQRWDEYKIRAAASEGLKRAP